ncbi:MAG: diguanylate cyclase [Gammaproteobacteria bacterium]|nr:diguanylate cyclase [Gammaproteobacteria bacterium]
MDHSEMADIDYKLLNNLPFGLLQLDSRQHITALNATLAELLGMAPGELLERRVSELPAGVQQLLGSEPQLFHDLANQRWLRRERFAGDAGEQLLLLVDVSEQERLAEENARLRQQVDDLKLTDELTGLANRRAIAQALDLHVSRSRRYQNPLSAVLVAVDLQKLASVRPLSTDPATLAVSRYLRDRLRWVDQIGRWDADQFLLVLPETSETDARGLLDKIVNEQGTMRLPEPYDDLRPQLTFGLACWSKGDDMRTLLRRANDDLQSGGTG